MGSGHCWGYFHIFGIIEIRELYLDMVKSFKQSQRNILQERKKKATNDIIHSTIEYTN